MVLSGGPERAEFDPLFKNLFHDSTFLMYIVSRNGMAASHGETEGNVLPSMSNCSEVVNRFEHALKFNFMPVPSEVALPSQPP